MPTLKVKLLRPNSKAPHYAKPGDAGLDIYSSDDIWLKPESTTIVHTGIATEFAPGWVLLYKGRSGLASKGIDVFGGVIDSGYRGEHLVLLYNSKKQSYQISAGDRIAQALFLPVPAVSVVVVDELSDSERGTDGFGSTGK